MEALFGKEKYVTAFGTSGTTTTQFIREPDGAWMGKSGPKNTRVSAVLLFKQLLPATTTRTSAILIHNPWARYPYDSSLSVFPQWTFKDGRRVLVNGLSIAELLQMEDGWPE
jgi:hypothetical protein